MANIDINDFLTNIEMARERFLYGLDQVPDDRLNWSPGGSAHTPLALAGRAAGFFSGLAGMLTEGSWPQPGGASMTTRDEARAAVDGAYARLKTALTGLTDEALARKVPAPWGEQIALANLVVGSASVTGYFQGQLNYVQLAYGDENPNIPPTWGHE